MKKINDLISEKPWIGWVIFLVTIAVVFALGLLASSIMERRTEAKLAFQVAKPIPEWEPRNEIWGENFPRQFERYQSTKESDFASRHGGSVEIDSLERDPRMIVLWAGYAFARDYNQGRGHYNAITDIRKTLRTGVAQPGTCWTCKSTDVPRLMKDLGVAQFYKKKWSDLGSEVVNPIGCQDCHDPKTMNLRITRPALAEALERQGKDVKKATHQEMRSLVCAQCHVEYYFKGDEKYLTFPWDQGLTAENIEKYYDQYDHVDWVHALSKTPMLKAQHPDYELWALGVHAQRGVACADCHMPYRSEGGVKFTDHKIQSPLNNIANSCQVCHRESEETLRQNVFERQDKVLELRLQAEDALVNAHIEAKAAWESGATEEEMKPILKLIRQAQWRWDYATASHGASFHAPLEVSRILGGATQKAGEARVLLARVLAAHGIQTPIAMPDISTKEKAQSFIGLDMSKLKAEKEEFMKNVLPEWDQKAKERQEKMTP
ncbi:MAG: ammonia-forming cytochrome c nitrite reductase [Candidatus Omnitrophota bacterium]